MWVTTGIAAFPLPQRTMNRSSHGTFVYAFASLDERLFLDLAQKNGILKLGN